jgi:diguanylate cyclase (GGDEF)-like protein
MPNEEAIRLVNRLREIIASLDWSAFSSGMQVTISAGVATLAPDESAEIILRRADNALYEAKAKGRNRTANA